MDTPNITEQKVREVLNSIIDPCSTAAGVPVGIVDMGLIRHLQLEPRADGTAISVRIGVTEPGCMMIFPFVKEAQERLSALPGAAYVEVRMDHACDWTEADMSPEYRAKLEAHRQPRREALRLYLQEQQNH